MKTAWKHETVQQGRSGTQVHEWCLAKMAELERQTSVPWSCESAHGEFRFHPYMTEKLAQEWCDEDAAESILEWLKAQPKMSYWGGNYRTLLAIAEGTGLPLFVVCGTAWAMVNSKIGPATLKVTIDRMGKPHAVALIGD